MRRLRILIWKELIELRREPRLFAIVIIAPVVQLFALGYAATTDVRDVPVVVADADRSVDSRELIRRFDASPSFTVVGVRATVDETGPYLESGRAWIALSIPRGYGSGLAAGRTETVQIVADGSDANSAGLSLGYATSLITSYSQERALERAQAAGLGPLPATALIASGQQASGIIEPRVRVWFNPRLISRDFMIPGIVALLLLVITSNLSSMAIVREREVGTLEQLNVTPLRRLELVVGKLLPYAFVGLIDVALVLTVSTLWFEVPFKGSFVLLIGMTCIYLISTLGLGLLISTISSTQQQAMMTTTFMFLLPMIYLSGFVFPIENMPDVIQWVTYLIPLRYFLVILRSLFLKGVGLEAFWPEALALTAWGLAVLTLAIFRSSKRVA
jgi:drug efflux transport system permease protein